jgi:hypothetical protein
MIRTAPIVAMALASSCAPINFAWIQAHEARLNAHTKRIVLLEGQLVDSSEQGRRMREEGAPTVQLTVTIPTSRKRAKGYVVLVPEHVYAGSIARHFAHPERVRQLPSELSHLVRIAGVDQPAEQGKATAVIEVENLPDGPYLVAMCEFERFETRRVRPGADDGIATVIHGYYSASTSIVDATANPIQLADAGDIDRPDVSPSGIEIPQTEVVKRRRTWRPEQRKGHD